MESFIKSAQQFDPQIKNIWSLVRFDVKVSGF